MTKALKILITNSVPLNSGDEALLYCLQWLIKDKFGSNIAISVLCHDPINCSKYFPSVKFGLDYERSLLAYSNKELFKKILRRIGLLLRKDPSNLFYNFAIAPEVQKISFNLYQDADIIFSSAGGYLHDFYGVDLRLKVYDMALKMNKPIFLIGHSIGPFWKNNSKSLLKSILPKIKKIVLRESISKSHLDSLELSDIQVEVKTDLGFLLFKVHPELFKTKANNNIKSVVINFRSWDSDDETEMIKNIAVALCKHLINYHGLDLTFISTCQGIAAYRDDSLFFEQIMTHLNESEKKSIIVNKSYHSFKEKIALYSSYDVYIGMRLHGAIFSMIGGTPAFNLGYEDKSKGIYEFLGLDEYQQHYSSSTKEILSSIDQFIIDCPFIQTSLKSKMEKASEIALTCLENIN